jgi:hypothetical protein
MGTSKDVAFVFSCPGAKEVEKPVSGYTGTCLGKLLKRIKKDDTLNKDFNFNDNTKICMYYYRITNAWCRVEYKKATKRTEADFEDLLKPENLCRLCDELEDINKIIFCFGRNASFAVDQIKEGLRFSKPELKIINLPHLSLQSLNQIKVNFKRSEATTERLERVFNCFSKQYNGRPDRCNSDDCLFTNLKPTCMWHSRQMFDCNQKPPCKNTLTDNS